MNIKNKAYLLIALVLVQSIIVFFLSNNLVFQAIVLKYAYSYSFFMVVLMNILGIAAIANVFYLYSFIKKEEESIKKLNHAKEINDALRGQKHDFFNHMNVVAGMINLNKYDKALNYIHDICGKTEKAFSISKIDSVEVAAILYRKTVIAENKGIKVELDITSTLQGLQISPIDLSAIFFNLLDNAIYELMEAPVEEKILTIDIQETDESFIIMIGNSYPVLDPNLRDIIFQPGYTTKEGSDHGHGLHIVKKAVTKYKGNINVESYEGVGTIFTIFFPRNKETS